MKNMRVYAFTVTRADTPERVELLRRTISQARERAAHPFYWELILSGVDAPLTQCRLTIDRNINKVTTHEDNIGQHVATNIALRHAKHHRADYFLRIDDDCEFMSQRWLRKLLRASKKLDDRMILSPAVVGLKHPPPRSTPCDVKGVTLEFLERAIGGVCRLHPMPLLRQHYYRADVRLALGAGDATGMGDWCMMYLIPMAYTKHIRVRHNTEKQEQEDVEYFSNHSIYQHIPYIPAM